MRFPWLRGPRRCCRRVLALSCVTCWNRGSTRRRMSSNIMPRSSRGCIMMFVHFGQFRNEWCICVLACGCCRGHRCHRLRFCCCACGRSLGGSLTTTCSRCSTLGSRCRRRHLSQPMQHNSTQLNMKREPRHSPADALVCEWCVAAGWINAIAKELTFQQLHQSIQSYSRLCKANANVAS